MRRSEQLFAPMILAPDRQQSKKKFGEFSDACFNRPRCYD